MRRVSCIMRVGEADGWAGGGGDDGCLVSPWFLIVAVGFLAFCTAPLLVCVFPWVWTVRHALSLSPLLSPAPSPLSRLPHQTIILAPPACVLPSPPASHPTSSYLSLSFSLTRNALSTPTPTSTSTLVLHSVIASPPSHPASLSLLHLSYISSRLSLSSCVTTITESQLAKQL